MKKTTLFLALTLIVSSFFISGCNSDSEDDKDPVDPTSYNITGLWDVYWEDETTSIEYFDLTQSDTSIAGIFYDEDEDNPSISGSISGSDIVFSVAYPSPVIFTVEAELNEAGNSFSGTVTVANSGVYDGIHNFRADKRL